MKYFPTVEVLSSKYFHRSTFKPIVWRDKGEVDCLSRKPPTAAHLAKADFLKSNSKISKYFRRNMKLITVKTPLGSHTGTRPMFKPYTHQDHATICAITVKKNDISSS